MRAIAKARLPDPTTDRVVSQTADAVNFLLTNSILSSNLVSVVFSGAGSKSIAHTLQKQPIGWVIVDKNTTAGLYRTAWDSSTLTLTASASGNFTILVF
jgi:hypothetical protein